MKCMHCGAEWTEGKNINAFEKCPFCGKTLKVTLSEDKELSMAKVLRQMVDIYGINIFSNPNKCISIFKDIAPELRNEQKILSVALTSGVGEYFTTCPVDERESNIKKAVHSMNYLSNDAKSLVVSSLAGALGWDTEIAERSLQQAIKDSQNNDQSLVKENCNIGMTSATPNQTNVSTNNINAVSAGGTKATNTNNTATVVGKGISFNRKWAVVAASVLVVLFGGYSMFSSGKDTSVTPVQNKQVMSEANINNASQSQNNMSLSDNVTQEQNSKDSKYNAKTSVGYPIYLKGDSNYIFVDGHMGHAWYLVQKGSQSREADGIKRITVEIVGVENAHQGNTTISGRQRIEFYFDEKSGQAGYGNPGENRYTYFNYNGDRSQTMMVNGAGAMAYYMYSFTPWKKFGYGKDFYSRYDNR